MDRFRGGFVALAIGVLALCPRVAGAKNETVIERGTSFVEPQIEIFVGETVTWVYESSPSNSGHSVVFDEPSLNDPNRFQNCPGFLLGDDCQKSSADRVVRTFRAPGRFTYHCGVHKSAMQGVVLVEERPAASSSTTPTLKSSSSTSSSRSVGSGNTSSSVTTTSRPLATSSSFSTSSTTSTTSDSSSVLLPGDAPAFPGEDGGSSAAGSSKDADGGSDTGTVVLIVALLLGVAGGGGFLLWRLRPGRA